MQTTPDCAPGSLTLPVQPSGVLSPSATKWSPFRAPFFNGIEKEIAVVLPSFSALAVLRRSQRPVSVDPGGSVPPAVHGEPSLPLQANVGAPPPTLNSLPPSFS